MSRALFLRDPRRAHSIRAACRAANPAVGLRDAWPGSKLGAEDIQKNAIRAKHVKNDRIGTAEVADYDSPNSLTGEDIEESTFDDGDADSATASRTLLNAGPFTFRALCGNDRQSATVQLVAPNGAVLRAAVSAEVNDIGADCSFAITVIGP